MHYTTSGKEMTDETEVGIYFYPEGYVPEERMGGGVGNAFSISIPAGAKDHEMELVTYIREDSDIHSLMPHMHFRGKRMKFKAVYPDGSEECCCPCLPTHSTGSWRMNWNLRSGCLPVPKLSRLERSTTHRRIVSIQTRVSK